MPSIAVQHGIENFSLYDLELVEPTTPRGPVVLRAIMRPRGSKLNLPMNVGDETFNLSAVLGNKHGEFEWGSGGFEQSATNFKIELRESNKRIFCADLQDKSGNLNHREFDLDEKFEMVDYVNHQNKEPYYRLGMKEPLPPRRTLVLCFDGTSNHFSNQNTNVVKFMELLKKTDPDRQMVYYQTGVGTYGPPSVVTSVGLAIAKKADEAVAWFLYQHVMDGYKYLVETYQIGDRISILGFSRGAFTARALAGMVHCVGLLPRHNIEHITFAYEVYRSADDRKEFKSSDEPVHGALYSPPTLAKHESTKDSSTTSLDEKSINGPAVKLGSSDSDTYSLISSSKPQNINPENFKRVFCIPVAIDFVGVWDTVASVGSILPKRLPWIHYNPSIRNFRQALALDERRANFIPSVWDHSRTDPDTQNVQEVWFKGGHTDVGGGAPMPKRSSGRSPQSCLSNISLRWMVRQCLEVDTGILFDYQSLEKYRQEEVLEVRPAKANLSAVDFERELLEQSEKLDQKDIVHEPYDAMKDQRIWNVLEFWPSPKPTQKGQKLGVTPKPNLYKPRSVHRPAFDWNNRASQSPVAIHSSVVNFLQKQEASQSKKTKSYVPRAIWHGYNLNVLPWIEDALSGCLVWGEKAKDAMRMDWKPKQTWRQSLWKRVGCFSG